MSDRSEIFSGWETIENYSPLLEPVKAVNMAPIGRRGKYQTSYEQGTIVSYTITSDKLVRGSQRSRFGLRKFKRIISVKTTKLN